MVRKVIMWFRSDLRLHDNESLCEAVRNADEVIPVYVFDSRIFSGKTAWGYPKTGIHRLRFLRESVANLRDNLRQIGSDLLVRTGIPEDIIASLAREYRTQFVYCNRERTRFEVRVQDALERQLWSIGQELRFSRGKMLYHTQDLPFPVTQTPDSFAHFRKEVEKLVPVRAPFPPPHHVPLPSKTFEPGEIPELGDFGADPAQESTGSTFFCGGEMAGLDRLHHYLWKDKAIQNYGESPSGLSDQNWSSRLSPWISSGCLSPKMIYWELKRYQLEYPDADQPDRLIHELEWRDYLRLMTKKYGNLVFQKGGILQSNPPTTTGDPQLLRQWLSGDTAEPFINACMKELNTTGYLSKIGRMATAAYLVHMLGQDWRAGASWFESMLLDYDPASNWMNWNYIAGTSPDHREFRLPNISNLAAKYDPKGTYRAYWGVH